MLRIRDVHPGSRIRIFSIRDPVSRVKKIPYPGSEFKYFNPKKLFLSYLFLSSGKYEPGCSSRIRILIFYPFRILDPSVKKAPDPDPQHWPVVWYLGRFFYLIRIWILVSLQASNIADPHSFHADLGVSFFYKMWIWIQILPFIISWIKNLCFARLRVCFFTYYYRNKYLSNNIIKKFEISHCLRSVKIIRTDPDTQILLSSKTQEVQHF